MSGISGLNLCFEFCAEALLCNTRLTPAIGVNLIIMLLCYYLRPETLLVPYGFCVFTVGSDIKLFVTAVLAGNLFSVLNSF